MSEQVRLCPHCGAAISGQTERCPRCDGWLSEPSVSSIEEDEETEVMLSRPAKISSLSADMAVEPVADGSDGSIDSADEASIEPTLEAPIDPPAPIIPVEISVKQTPTVEPSGDAQPDPFRESSDLFDPLTEDVVSTFRSVDNLANVAVDKPAEPIPNPLDDTGEHQPTPADDPLILTHDTPQNALHDTPPRGNSRVVPAEFEEAHTEPVTYGQLLRPAPIVPLPEPLPAMDTQPKMLQPLPPAPFTPPPIMVQPSAANTVSDQSYQQRILTYAQGGYRLVQRLPNECVMAYGKSLSFLWWIIASASGFGIVWYWFVLLVAGFRADRVYILLEPDGYVYEEGPGAAHIRRRRSRNSRRWGVFGAFMLLVSVFSLILAILAGSVMLDRYQNELNAAYPELGIFTNSIPPANLDATEVQNVRVAVLALLVLSALSISGVVAGIMITMIGYLQAAAYRVKVAPLPYMR